MMTKSHQTATKQYLAQTREIFYCRCKIKIPLEAGEQLLDDCFEIMENIDRTYNSYQPGSYFDKINRNTESWVEVDDLTTGILWTLKTVSDLTNGVYDVTSMPLLKLWGFYKQHGKKIPSETEIRQVLKQVNYNLISIEGNNVRIEKGQELITGSFIKAVAVDQVVRFLKNNGVRDAIINAGGSTIFAMNKEQEPHWYIRIPDPFGDEEQRIRLDNTCFNLSGKTNNHILIDGKKYGHILNAEKGLPSDTEQVGIITDNAFIGDVLSTALFAVEKENFPLVVDKLQQHFSFDYYRLEHNGTRTKCF